jgi:hypothetical protein
MFENVQKLIEKRLRDNWTFTEIDWDNVRFNPTRGTAWIRCRVDWSASESRAAGPRVHSEGFVLISIFVPAEQSVIPGVSLAEEVHRLFSLWQVGDLTMRAAHTERVGQVKEWYQLNVVVPFYYNECMI